MTAIVVNKYKDQTDPSLTINVMQGSLFGNPFAKKGMTDSERDEVCDKYEIFFHNTLLNTESVKVYLDELIERASQGDLYLQCCCLPKRCHAETIANYINDRIKTVTTTKPSGFQTFSAFEYLCIDVANTAGLDKETFETRINWVKENYKNLDEIDHTGEYVFKGEEHKVDSPRLFKKAVYAMRDVVAGKPTGHMIEFDATTSGVQIMSAATGCRKGGLLTNLVDPTTRYDAYTMTTDFVNNKIGGGLTFLRKQIKTAVMCFFYGSKAEPKKVFGKGTPELAAFYEVMSEEMPGAYALMDALLACWNPEALSHDWTLPDGFKAHVPVMDEEIEKIEIQELGVRFNHQFRINRATEFGLSIAANVVHSLDGYVVREVNRRCNYDRDQLTKVASILRANVTEEIMAAKHDTSKMISLAMIEGIDSYSVKGMPAEDVARLLRIVEGCLGSDSFPVVCIHDAYKCHPNHMNDMRWHYKEILAEIAESTILDQIFTELRGKETKLKKLSLNFAATIRNSNYAIC